MTGDDNPGDTPATYMSGGRYPLRFNSLVVIEMTMGIPAEHRIGRLVQVRRGTGPFGTDTVIIRCRDGSLRTFCNCLVRPAGDRDFEDSFYRFNGQSPPVIGDESEYPCDGPGNEYLIAGEYPEVGFLVEEPAGPPPPAVSFAIAIGKHNDNLGG